MTQWAFYFDQQRCVGCRTCEISCKDWHNLKDGVSWRRVMRIEDGAFPRPTVSYLSLSCHHCVDPACVGACPTGAIRKRLEDGIVVVDSSECTGCLACVEACPYEAPRVDGDEPPTVSKCDLCVGELALGREPVCVASCPLRALDAGPLDVIEARHGGSARHAVGFEPVTGTGPALIFRRRSHPWG